MIIRLAALLLASTLAAQTIEAPASPSPVQQVLLDALGPRAAEVGKTPTFNALVAAMTPEIRADAKTKLDGLDRALLTTLVLTDLSKVYSLLGSHSSAAQAALALQEREPKATQGFVIASNAKLDEGDYAGSVKLAAEALKIDSKDPAALAVWHSAKGRVAPTSLSSNSQPASQNPAGSVQTATVDDRPLKVGVTKPTMGVVPEFKKDSPVHSVPNGHPWLPYAVGFGLTVFGIGLSIKHSLEDAKGTVMQTVDMAGDGAANLFDRGVDWAQDHPKTMIALGVGAVVVSGGLVLSGGAIGGGGMMLATAGGPTTIVAATAGSVSASQVAAAGGAVAVPLLMAGDAPVNSKKLDTGSNEPSTESSKPEVTFKGEHGGRHLEGTNIGSSKVEKAIRNALESLLKEKPSTGGHWGRVKVDGQVIEYRAYRVSPKQMNVGTYYPVN